MSKKSESREPRVFDLDDPAVVPTDPEPAPIFTPSARGAGSLPPSKPARPQRSLASWGTLLVSSLAALAMLAATMWFANFVSVLFTRNDWIGWTAMALLAMAMLAAAVIVVRELIGLVRLGRLSGLKADIASALRDRDRTAEASAVRRLRALYAGRGEVAWGVARVKEHEADIREPGELLALADRELMVPLDNTARRLIAKSARRVATVTAMSPLMMIAVVFVAVENLRLLRALATLYGGSPGGIGALKLARMVFTHIVATGGVALTDDLLGQFLGQDLLRRLSRRLGEGVFNGALTARIGAAAIEVVRPLPYIEANPVRVRDLVATIFQRSSAEAAEPPEKRRG